MALKVWPTPPTAVSTFPIPKTTSYGASIGSQERFQLWWEPASGVTVRTASRFRANSHGRMECLFRAARFTLAIARTTASACCRYRKEELAADYADYAD